MLKHIVVVAACVLVGCSGRGAIHAGTPQAPTSTATEDDADGGDSSSSSREDGGASTCQADSDCDDGVFCNGAETCNVHDARADRAGCVIQRGPVCDDGSACTSDVCDEAGRVCIFTGLPDDGSGACASVSACLNNGGCDALTDCTVVDGRAHCGACPQGYIGTGESGCTPILTGLSVGNGVLSPMLDANATDYLVKVTLATEPITLTPTAATGVDIHIAGVLVDSSYTWTEVIPKVGSSLITITVSRRGHPSRAYAIEILRDPGIAYIKASNAEMGDQFGLSVAISGDTLVVGAPYESSSAQGVNSTSPGQGDNAAPTSGAVYVFVRHDSAWEQQAYLKPSNTGSGDMFGLSVAISGDTIVVGAAAEDSAATGVNNLTPGQADNSATDSGAAYVFVRKDGNWSQEAYLKASNAESGDEFGHAVSVSGDTVIVGAHGEDGAGVGVDNANPGPKDNSAMDSGAAYVFIRKANQWNQEAYLKAGNAETGDAFGISVAVSDQTLVVGSFYESSAASGVNNTSPGPGDNKLPYSGAAYVFDRSGSAWQQTAYLKAHNPEASAFLGASVAISDGTIVVGAMGDHGGRVYVFSNAAGTWTEQAMLATENMTNYDFFGASVAISGDRLIVGDYGESRMGRGRDHLDPGPAQDVSMESGAAYLYERSNGMWAQRAYLKATNPDPLDHFGGSVAISETTLVVGAISEDSAAQGVNSIKPGQDDNSAYSSGAVYVF